MTGVRPVIYEVLDDRFRRCANGDQQLDVLHDGCRWAEGPLDLPAGRYLVWSDIPNDRMLRWDEVTGGVGVFRSPAGHPSLARGHTSATRTSSDGYPGTGNAQAPDR